MNIQQCHIHHLIRGALSNISDVHRIFWSNGNALTTVA